MSNILGNENVGSSVSANNIKNIKKRKHKRRNKYKITKSRTLFILDWDDTLFPTSWVVSNGINLQSSSRDNYIVYFQELDRSLNKFLSNIMKLGKVIIITNALLDWIQISSVVLPNTYNLLSKIEVVSARGDYRGKSSNMMDWKIMAFRDVVDREFRKSSTLNIISVGDAEFEYHALIAINKSHPENPKYLKSIKFVKEPSHEILIDQLAVLNDAVTEIWDKHEHLDLIFRLK